MKLAKFSSWICCCFQIRRLLCSRQETMSPAAVARQGRHRQRYDGCYRLVAGCIPYMLKGSAENDCCDLVDGLQVLMISTPNRNDLIFPKGGWENDEAVDEAACREALEEAGVKGIIQETPLGEWIFKSKSSQNSCSLEGACKGYIFALKVTELLDSWPEQAGHGRQWVSVEEAYSLCRYEWMREALDKLKESLFGSNFMPLLPAELRDSSNLCMITPAVAEGAVAFC